MTTASQIMSSEIAIARPQHSLQQAAYVMRELDTGFLPVGDNDRLVGIVTDRDIAVRGTADGMSPNATVGEVMSEDVKYCYEDDDIEEVARNMADIQVRRLPVVDRNKRLVGVLSLADIAVHDGGAGGRAVRGISRPGGEHNQSGDGRGTAW
jgi:CBS domain-containing protein